MSNRSSPSRVRFAASRPGRLRADPKNALLTRGKEGSGSDSYFVSHLILFDSIEPRLKSGVFGPCGRAEREPFGHTWTPEPQPWGAVIRRAVAQRRSRADGLTRLLAEAIRGFDSGFGLGFVVGPLARSAAVWCKSFVFSSLLIRKVLILPFAGGVSPPFPVFFFCFQRVIHRIVAPTTCSVLLVLYYLYGGSLCTYLDQGEGSLCTYLDQGGGFTLHVENSPESHKPVEIGDLRSQGASRSREALEVQTGPPKPSGAIPAPGKGGLAD